MIVKGGSNKGVILRVREHLKDRWRSFGLYPQDEDSGCGLHLAGAGNEEGR